MLPLALAALVNLYFDTMLPLNKEPLVSERPGETAAHETAYFAAALLAGLIPPAVGVHPDPEKQISRLREAPHRAQFQRA